MAPTEEVWLPREVRNYDTGMMYLVTCLIGVVTMPAMSCRYVIPRSHS